MKRIILPLLLVCIFSALFSQTYSIINVYTPKGTAVQAGYLTGGELNSTQKAAITATITAAHPNVTILDEPTWTYNCHGYAWHISEGKSPIVWINAIDQSSNPNVQKYWEDGSFIEVCNEAEAEKIHYYAGDHSAIVTINCRN